MKTSIIAILLFIGFGPAHSAEAKPQSARYTLNVQKTEDGTNSKVSLRDNQLKRNLWTRKVYSANPRTTWSSDKRAVFIGGVGHFLVWREGYALRDFGTGRYDYTMGCAWSPDKQRLVVRFGMSAMSDFDAGTLFCLKLGDKKFYKYSSVARGVREMKWRDNQTVLFRVFDYGTGKVSRQRKWRVR